MDTVTIQPENPKSMYTYSIAVFTLLKGFSDGQCNLICDGSLLSDYPEFGVHSYDL